MGICTGLFTSQARDWSRDDDISRVQIMWDKLYKMFYNVKMEWKILNEIYVDCVTRLSKFFFKNEILDTLNSWIKLYT